MFETCVCMYIIIRKLSHLASQMSEKSLEDEDCHSKNGVPSQFHFSGGSRGVSTVSAETPFGTPKFFLLSTLLKMECSDTPYSVCF